MKPEMLLLTPGPTPIPPAVTQTMGQAFPHHRTPEFKSMFENVRNQMKRVFQTTAEPLFLSCSGTGVMDATFVSLLSPSDEIIYVDGGKFGERWGDLAKAYGVTAHRVWAERGNAVSIDDVEKKILEFPKSKAVFFQASETSTAVKHPTQAIVKLCQKHNMLSVCDGITALGVFDLPMDRWGIDVLMSASQKAFMLPPGLSMVALSEKAWKVTKQSKLPKFYFDLARELKAHLNNQTAWTPAIGLIQGMQTSLDLMLNPGLDSCFKRHERLAFGARFAFQQMGFKLFSNAPSEALTAIYVPSTITDPKAWRKKIREDYQVVLVGGQGELEDKILRLSHFGFCFEADLLRGLMAIEATYQRILNIKPESVFYQKLLEEPKWQSLS